MTSQIRSHLEYLIPTDNVVGWLAVVRALKENSGQPGRKHLTMILLKTNMYKQVTNAIFLIVTEITSLEIIS